MDSGSLLHYPHSSEIISLFFNSPLLTPYLCPSFKQSSRFCKGKEKEKNQMNPHYTKGTKWTDFQPWIVSKWMIIWLISGINNNNCLSLLIRALNSKWNSSAEFQRAGFTAQDLVLRGGKKRDDPILQMPTCQSLKPEEQEKRGLRDLQGRCLGAETEYFLFPLMLKDYASFQASKTWAPRAMDTDHWSQNIEGRILPCSKIT